MILLQPCFICRVEMSKATGHVNGVDALIAGHHMCSSLVSMCWVCNHLKGADLSVDSAIGHVAKIWLFQHITMSQGVVAPNHLTIAQCLLQSFTPCKHDGTPFEQLACKEIVNRLCAPDDGVCWPHTLSKQVAICGNPSNNGKSPLLLLLTSHLYLSCLTTWWLKN